MTEGQPRVVREAEQILSAAADDVSGARAEIEGVRPLEPSELDQLENVLRLVAALGVDHTLARDGFVLLPASCGDYDMTVTPVEVDGKAYVSLGVFMLVDVPRDPALEPAIQALLADLNLPEVGLKFCHFPELGTICAVADLPAEGLEPLQLAVAMRQVVRAVARARPAFADLGVGRLLESVWRQKGWPVGHGFS